MSAHAASLAQLGALRARGQHAGAGRACSAAPAAARQAAAAAASAWRSTDGRVRVLCARSARPRAPRACGALRVVANAAVAPGFDGEPAPSASLLGAFWKFLRPHTIRGTVLGTSAVVIRALSENPALIDFGLVPRALLGLLALLCGNGYIVGINQIYDISIDKVNKPFLPVASGEMSVRFAWVAVLALAVGGASIVTYNFGQLITGLYCFGLCLGTLYSVPPFRLKRFPLPAFMIIATVRGFLLNFGVYHATRSALLLPFEWSPAITFITCFVTMFATVIAITKDLPDVEGDRQHDIQTFATQLGVRNISLAAIGMLLASYATAIVIALRLPGVFCAPVMVGGHAVLAAALLLKTLDLERSKYTPDAIQAFYRFIWTLFYSEYALLPFLQEIEQALAEMPALLPFLLFPDKPLLSFGTLKTTLRDALVVSVTVVTMMFAARLWDFLVILVLKYGMSALVGQPPLPHT